jgi:CCR4-NOT transcription complex subunit 1
VQLGTPLTLGNLSQSQAMASVPLPLQFQSQRSALQEERLKSASSLAESVKAATSITQSAPLPQQSLAAGSQTFDLGSAQKVSQLAQGTVYSSLANGQSATVNQGFLRSARAGIAGVLRQPLVATGFGHALNIETLVAAAERRDTPIEPPSSDVQDKVAFIINNIVTANLEQKAKECLEVLKEQYYPWFAQYMVMKR